MADENAPRLRAECAHTWEMVDSVGRRCQKCQLSWEIWAEERMAALEQRLNAVEESADEEEYNVALVTLLPPQTEYTCPACNGTGQTPLFEYSLICSLCSCAYGLELIEEMNAESVLPCGHSAKSIVAVNYCLQCGGSGTC